ncbi:MAG: ABC transporter permease, partial [Myxococcota bacterium]
MPILHDALNATKENYAAPAVQALTVEPTKRDIVATAETAGQQFTLFLTTLSSFTILAGVLLVVNLFTMLGEERRVELSVMRALGMRRRHLVGSLTLEGSLYAIPGAPVGALLGIALAWGLIEVINQFVTSQDALPIPFLISWWTPIVAALYALAFVLLAIAFTGWNLSRQNIAAGLKGLKEERVGKRTRRALILVGVGLLLTGLGSLTGSFTLYYLGPTALIFGGTLLATRRFRPEIGRFIGAALAVPYGLWTVTAFSSVGTNEAPILAPTRGTTLVLLAVVLLLNIPGLAYALKGLARRLGTRAPATMVALSYPTTRRLRTGLT